MKKHPLAGRKQTPEHIAKRVESVRKKVASWTEEKRQEFASKISSVMRNRPKELREKFMYCHVGKPAWNKGKKIPQISGPNHWNWGNNMPQESIEKMRKSLTGKKQSLEVIKKRFDARAGYIHSEETKKKIGKANKGSNNGMFGRIKDMSSNWRGGISFEPYPITWTFSLREAIRRRDGRKCGICGIEENGKRHDVHHIDYNKKNILPFNLITLCLPCHRKTNYHREKWQEFFEEQRQLSLFTGSIPAPEK